jgi:predicted AlkP superfamily pyrophosphatase or phosphodiesterase
VDVLRLWLRWLNEDPASADRVKDTGKKLMINGTLGGLEEARAIMSFQPDWILIDDVVQLQESLRQIASAEEDGITQIESVHTGARHLVIVVDGLRPDYVTPEIMPNVYAMGQSGVIGSNAFAVFPSFTRPNRTAIPTGVYPHKHGLIHNSMLHPNLDSPVHTGRMNDLAEYAGVSDTPMVTTVSLGELMEEQGKNLLAIGHGSWLLNHKAKGKGWMMPGNFSQPESVVEEILDAVGETPSGSRSPARTAWVTDLYLYDSLGDDPADVVLMWYGETDAAGHSYGVGAPETLEAVSHVDEQIGRILETHEEHSLSDEVNIFITSDHGFTQNTGNFRAADFVEEAGLKDQVDFVRNMFYIENGDEETMQQMVEALQRNEYVGAIYTQPNNPGDTEGRIPGTLSTDLIQWTHERSSDILASPAWNDEENEFGWPGTTTRSGTATHGSESPYDMRIPLVAAGPDIKQGVESSVPTGNVDFTPTMLYLMGITPPAHMDGRVLHEILTDGPDPDDVAVEAARHPVSVSYPDGFTYQTKLITLSVGSTHYIREARTERSVSEE